MSDISFDIMICFFILYGMVSFVATILFVLYFVVDKFYMLYIDKLSKSDAYKIAVSDWYNFQNEYRHKYKTGVVKKYQYEVRLPFPSFEKVSIDTDDDGNFYGYSNLDTWEFIQFVRKSKKHLKW